MQKYRKSPFTIIFYVFAACMCIYTVYVIGSTVAQINNYYDQFEMTPGFAEVLTYVLQSAMTPLAETLGMFGVGMILDEVRKLNPAYYSAAEEKTADAGVEAEAEVEVAETEDAVVITEDDGEGAAVSVGDEEATEAGSDDADPEQAEAAVTEAAEDEAAEAVTGESEKAE